MLFIVAKLVLLCHSRESGNPCYIQDMTLEQNFEDLKKTFLRLRETYPTLDWEREVLEWCEVNEIYDVSQHDLSDENGENTRARWQLAWSTSTMLNGQIFIDTDENRNPTESTMQVYGRHGRQIKIFVLPEEIILSESNIQQTLSKLKEIAEKVTTDDLSPLEDLTA